MLNSNDYTHKLISSWKDFLNWTSEYMKTDPQEKRSYFYEKCGESL